MVTSARFSPDGQRVLTATQDKTARIWDANTGGALLNPLKHEAAVTSARFSADGLRVVTASDGKTARVWDAMTGHPMTNPLKHEAEVRSAQFSPDVDVADWFGQPKEANKRLMIAWTGTNEASRAQRRSVRLFKSTWENPWPDERGDSICFVWSRQGRAAPFLVAITAE